MVRSLLLLMAILFALTGCAALRGQEAPVPPPTFDPALLSVTPPPTSTPLPTFTPYPTTERMPTSTPHPTFPPRLLLTPTETPGAAVSAGGAVLQPPPVFSGYIGIEGAGPRIAELEPILIILTDGVTCGEPTIVQLGVINWGTEVARDFVVEWSAGIQYEQGVDTVAILDWGSLPVYFRNKPIAYPCTQTTTYTAYVRVDITNVVPEIYEDNNSLEFTFTIPYVEGTDAGS